MHGLRWATRVGVLAVALAGCARGPNPADVAELAQVKAQSKTLNAQLDDLGARLLFDQHRMLTDSELKSRHQHVSELACSNLAGHWAGINRFLDNQRDKTRALHASRVAAADSPAQAH